MRNRTIERIRAKEIEERAKIAELKRQVMEAKLIKKTDVVLLLKKLARIKCENCEKTILEIISNVEAFELS